MKMIRSLLPTLILGVFLLGAVTASAQRGTPNIAPDKQFGIGVFTGGSFTGGGITGQYAISPSLQLGVALGVQGSSANSTTVTNYNTEIYGRFLFEGNVNPFLQATFGRTSQDFTSGTVTTTTTSNSLAVGFGLEYFFNHNVGVQAMVNVVKLNFDPSSTEFGFGSGRVGLEWYFNP
ncbi:MAG: outer membrane beta-barrel protein [Candidatus Kapaibacterium sp.]